MNYFHQRWAIWFSKGDELTMRELIYDRNPVYPLGGYDESGYPSGGTKFVTIGEAVRALDWCKIHYDPEKYHFAIATYSIWIGEGVG